MSGSDFILLSGIVLLAIVFLGLLRPPKPAPAPVDEVHRWAVFRLHPARLLSGEAPAFEPLTGGPRLAPAGPLETLRPARLALLEPGGKPRILIRCRKRLGRTVLKIRLDRRTLGHLRASRRAAGTLPQLFWAGPGVELFGDASSMEIEVRRAGRTVAAISPRIAPATGALGVEVLASEDPLPLLALAAGLGLLSALRPATPQGKAAAA